MSGGFGWNGNSTRNNRGSSDWDDARSAYTKPAPAPPQRSVIPPPTYVVASKLAPTTPQKSPRDLHACFGPHPKVVTTKKNVIIVALDMTGSMSSWRSEVLGRLSTFFIASTKLLGEGDVEILFMSFGDPGYCAGDTLVTTPQGSGQILEEYIKAIDVDQAGGNNAEEGAQYAAWYVEKHVDTSSAHRTFFFTITDEKCGSAVMENVTRRVGLEPGHMLSKSLYRGLMHRMHVYTIFADTRSYGVRHANEFLPFWRDLLNDPELPEDHVIPLNDSRRVVDVMLGAIAKLSAQYETFTSMLHTFQGHTKHGSENIAAVHKSLTFVGSAAKVSGGSAPSKVAKSLLGD